MGGSTPLPAWQICVLVLVSGLGGVTHPDGKGKVFKYPSAGNARGSRVIPKRARIWGTGPGIAGADVGGTE
jgi:hypothetical protein